MTAFQRLSTVPTIPELVRQDRRRWLTQVSLALPLPWRLPSSGIDDPVRAALLSGWTRRTRMAACFAGAYGLLAAARVLNGYGLLSPQGIGAFFSRAERLTWAGMHVWHALRRERWLEERAFDQPFTPDERCGGTLTSKYSTEASRPCA